MQTSDVRAAGTDAAVHLIMHGSRAGKSCRVPCDGERLRLETSRNNFERAALDEFVIARQPRLDAIESITVGHDNRGMFAGWHLDWVEITIEGGGVHHFAHTDWIEADARGVAEVRAERGLGSTECFLRAGGYPTYRKRALTICHPLQRPGSMTCR